MAKIREFEKISSWYTGAAGRVTVHTAFVLSVCVRVSVRLHMKCMYLHVELRVHRWMQMGVWVGDGGWVSFCVRLFRELKRRIWPSTVELLL